MPPVPMFTTSDTPADNLPLIRVRCAADKAGAHHPRDSARGSGEIVCFMCTITKTTEVNPASETGRG